MFPLSSDIYYVRSQLTLNNGTYIEDEFQDVYLVKKDIEASALTLEEGQVESVRWISACQNFRNG
jgi:hypothetical protein